MCNRVIANLAFDRACLTQEQSNLAFERRHCKAALAEHIDRAREQIGRLETALKDAGAHCFGIYELPCRMPTVALSVETRPSAEIASSLKTFGITVGSGLQCSPLAHQTMGTEGAGLVRISVGMEQNAREIEAAIDAICRRVST